MCGEPVGWEALLRGEGNQSILKHSIVNGQCEIPRKSTSFLTLSVTELTRA